MGTRGIYGFRKNGVDKVSYNHFDSYPSELGTDVLSFVSQMNDEKLNQMYDGIQLVEECGHPTYEQWRDIHTYLKDDFTKEDPKETDWYNLLRCFQGNLQMLNDFMRKNDGVGYMTDAKDFIKDSVFCEYGYIVNLDSGMLEYWKGFQKEPDETNRYGTDKVDEDTNYYPCKLTLEIPLTDLYGKEEDVPKYIFQMNFQEEKVDELIDLIEESGWSIKMEDNWVSLWIPNEDGPIFDAEFDGTRYSLVHSIMEEMKNFDPDQYAYENIVENSPPDIDTIRDYCDEAEHIAEDCNMLVSVIENSL